jgi:predicted porin
MTVLAACCLHAQAQSVTVFGVLDVNVRHIDNGAAGSLSSMSSDGLQQSRLGFRGTEDLGGGLQAGFWLESSVSPDTGQTNPTRFYHRRSTVSLASDSVGELRLGRDYTGIWLNALQFDAFTTGIGSSTNVLPPNIGTQAVQTLMRADNMVAYFLPRDLGGFYGQVQYAFGENVDSNKYAGARIGYAKGPVDVALAYGETKTTSPGKVKLADLGASYVAGPVTVFAQFAKIEFNPWSRTNAVLGAAWAIGPGLIRASYTHSNFSGTACPASVKTCDDARLLALGYVYYLSKRTALYGTAAFLDNGDRGAISLPGGPGLAVGDNSKGVEAGIRHAF